MKGCERKGAGRKPGSPNKVKKENTLSAVVKVRLSAAEHATATACAERKSEKLSEFIRSAIEAWCHKHP